MVIGDWSCGAGRRGGNSCGRISGRGVSKDSEREPFRVGVIRKFVRAFPRWIKVRKLVVVAVDVAAYFLQHFTRCRGVFAVLDKQDWGFTFFYSKKFARCCLEHLGDLVDLLS
jgi:hypothetical protein